MDRNILSKLPLNALQVADKLSVLTLWAFYDKETLIGFAMYDCFWNIRLNGQSVARPTLIGAPFREKGMEKLHCKL